MDELFEGVQYWRRDGSVSPPLIGGKGTLLRDPGTCYMFMRKNAPHWIKLGHVWPKADDDKDLVAPYIPVQPTEEALQALL